MESIESSIFKGLMVSDDFARSVYPHLDEKYFDGAYRTLFKVYSDLFDKYSHPPTLEALAIGLSKSNVDESNFGDIEEVIEYVVENKDEPINVEWLIDETEGYCKDKAIYDAVYKSINIIHGEDTKLDKHAIPTLLDEALAVSFDQTLGMDYFNDAEARYLEYTSEESTIKFPLEELNRLSNGGLRKGTLSCILAGTNVGKSALMCYLAGEFLRMGYNVLYISLEMSEASVQQRVDANLLGVKTDDLKKMSKEQFLTGINSIQNKTKGRFLAKQYPTGQAHTGHYRHFIKEARQKKGFKPDIIMHDYINIGASSRYKSLSGVNSYSYVKAMAEELRGLAVELDVPILTATQTTRGGSKEDTPDMTSTSESFGLPATLDWFIAITTDEAMMENNQQLIHLLKTRFGNKKNAKPELIGIDFDLMRYYSPGSTSEMQTKVTNNAPRMGVDKKKNSDKLAGMDWD